MSAESEAEVLNMLLAEAEADRAEDEKARKELGEKIDALAVQVKALSEQAQALAADRQQSGKIDMLIASVRALTEAAKSVITTAAKDKGLKGGKKISVTVTGRDASGEIENADIVIKAMH